MQLDNTRIAIRERDLLETLDLALHVTRQFAGPWLLLSLLAIVPLAIINYALIGWMLPDDLDDQAIPWRFAWNMILLIYLEAPLWTATTAGPRSGWRRRKRVSRPELKRSSRSLAQAYVP